MKFRATAEDLAKGQIVSPGWMAVEVIDVEETQDKTDNPAGLLVVRAKVIGGKDEDKGAILRTNFSEKAPAFIKNFVEALGIKFEADKDYNITTSAVKGKKMMWYVERGSYRGRPNNQVVDYKPLEA